MRTTKTIGVLLGLIFAAGSAVAQDDAPTRYTYATYFHCNVGLEEAADAVMERDAPIIDGLVEDGTILSWGWLSHHTGGDWRRIRYHQSDTLEGAMTALQAVNEAVTEVHGEDDAAAEAFSEACPRHDDYVWEAEAGTIGDTRGTVGFSVYHFCDMNREERADEIVKESIAPVLDKMVEDGKLTTWGWQSHVVGGRIRRLQTMTATDLGSLLSARQESIELIYAENEAAGTEFTEICGAHLDYVWNIDHEKN
jgi:hypothetical protein